MTHDDWVKWCDQLENSLVRAESARKDLDLIVMLRLAHQIAKDKVKEGEKNGGDKARR